MARRFTPASIGLHWLMFLLMAAVYASIELRELFPKGTPTREAFKSWHFMLGLTVLVLVAVRLLARRLGGVPPITPPPPLWQRILAHAVHWALYALMIGLPLLGWALLSAADKPVVWLGIELPALVDPNPDLAKQIKFWHERIATAGYWLIGLHVVAALYHHFVRRDDTMLRMLPRR